MARQGTGARVEVRIYMEGCLIEDALVNVTVGGTTGSPASCQLELVPTNTIRHIMPGTWVHVFATDPWDLNPGQDIGDFKLLFEGVVIGRGFNRMDDGRNFMVHLASPEVYWATAKQFWLSIGSANGDIVDQLAVQTSGGYGRFGKVTSTGTFGYMVSKLAFKRKDSEQAEERFIDTLISVIDDIGNVNPYYTNARNRFRITDRIIRAPAGNTEKLFQLAMLGDFLDGISGRKSGQTNLVEVVNQLLSSIMHEWVSILAPPYVKARIFDRDVFGNIKRTKQTLKGRGPRGKSKVEIFDFKVVEDDVVASVMFKPHVYTIDPPNFNVLFPNMYDQMSYHEDFMGEVTRVSMKPQLPVVSAKLTQGLLLQRPVELEVFTSLIRDPKRKTNHKRTPDGKYGDAEGQAPTFTDYDWTTNEERIRGIVYNFINMAPAPSALTLTDPGKRQPNGTRKGGVPKYLQNVASYEYYKSKFMSRTTGVQGPFNMRVVPGFPMVILDDSPSKLNVVCYLAGVQHSIDSNGSAMTQYTVKYPRIADEVDYNQPLFEGGFNPDKGLDLNLAREDDGSFNFEKIFSGSNQPPVPEWFDESLTNTLDLDLKYQEWFGEDAGVMQGILFRTEDSAPLEAAIKSAGEAIEGFSSTEVLNSGIIESEGIKAGGSIKLTDEAKQQAFDEIRRLNENVSINDGIDELNRQFRIARGLGKEFELSSRLTNRTFTRIDEAFRFVGAAPVEIRDKKSADKSAKNRVITFSESPAEGRVIDYKTLRLDKFAGDVSSGSGYSGKAFPGSTNPADDAADRSSGEDKNRMSGAFPQFDAEIHKGKAATDKKERDKVAKAQRGKSDRARYDGRPLMYDFEFRLWQESLRNAGIAPNEKEIVENSKRGDYSFVDSTGGSVKIKTPEELNIAIAQQREVINARNRRLKALVRRGKHDPTARKGLTMPPECQAPTGDLLDGTDKKALPQPLSEKQVIDLRRSIVEAYQKELKSTRGITG